MARDVDAIDLPVAIEEAFDHLADFSRTVGWEPGVCEVRSHPLRLNEGVA